MSTLGEILDQLYDRAQVYQILAESGDLVLMSRPDQIAVETEADVREIALGAVRAFTASADAEAWVRLIGRIQDSQSPAGACLGEMITWSMKQ